MTITIYLGIYLIMDLTSNTFVNRVRLCTAYISLDIGYYWGYLGVGLTLEFYPL